MTAKKKPQRREQNEDLVFGLAWYRREEWPELLSAAIDREKLENTYAERKMGHCNRENRRGK